MVRHNLDALACQYQLNINRLIQKEKVKDKIRKLQGPTKS